MTEADSKEPRDPEQLEAELMQLRERFRDLRAAIGRDFLGQSHVVEMLLFTVLARGHALLEGAPGLGKTTLVKGLAQALNLAFGRIQFTPDLMPADVLGARILEDTPEGGHAFRFERGPIFANLILADEINRATPRTQSALLEAMQEGQVTIFGESLQLPQPFAVIATQNPIEMEGTYPLPEAQLDRFLCKIELVAPSESDLIAILRSTTGKPHAPIEVAMTAEELLAAQELVRELPASGDVLARVARLVRATDPADASAPASVRHALRYGAGPRGAQAVLLLAKARALLSAKLHVGEEDVEAVAAPALRHRFVLGYEGAA
ncbi:MAG: MoxR-like ATPase, partial [Planctomycetota bacterium]